MRLRVYFNMKSDAPLVWSVDAGDSSSEVICEQVMVLIPLRGGYNAAYNPCAWLEGTGVALMRDRTVWLVGPETAAAMLESRADYRRLFTAGKA